MDYEHFPLRCCKFHEQGHLYRDYPSNKLESNIKTATRKDPEGFTKVGGKAKGGKWYQNKINEDGKPSHNSFKILEEEDRNNEANQEVETNTNDKDRDASMEDIRDNNQQKDHLPSIVELNRDHEMTPSEVGMEDHELHEIIERDSLDLEKFLEKGISKVVDSLP